MDLPLGLGAPGAAFLLVAVLGAAIVRGFAGFGFSALVVSAAGFVGDPMRAVPVVLFCEVVMTLQVARGIVADIDWVRVGCLLIGALIGLPIGLSFLLAIGVDGARAAISVFILGICILLVSGWRLRRALGALGNVGLGLVSGVANGAAMAGLPVAAAMSAQPIPPRVFRATLIVYFAALDLLSLPVMWRAGLIGRDTVLAALATMPVLLLGNGLGQWGFARSRPAGFRLIAVALLASLASMGLGKAVLGHV
ncbi:sulfite exporter TauE/SafE family protein [Albidovulum inexpectatum]|nr:sulfite exporter TauE/SafE family protein [Albidovulum inexpectatum]